MGAIALAGASAFYLAGCNLNSSDEGKTEVSNYNDMPICGGEGGASGKTAEGAKLYVSDEEALYVCSDSGWVVESVSTFDMLPLCTNKGRKSLIGQKIYVQADSAYFRCLKSGWTRTEEDDDGDGSVPTPTLDNNMVSGVATAIGPFAKGARVELREITRDERTHKIRIEDSVFVGEVSMKRAAGELKDAFGLASDDETVQFAEALLLRSNLDEGEFVETLAAFAEDFAEDGLWSDEKNLTAFADFAFNKVEAVADCRTGRYSRRYRLTARQKSILECLDLAEKDVDEFARNL